jgi:multiple sugar transport system ATP-binding protein
LTIAKSRHNSLKSYLGQSIVMGLRPEDFYDAEYVAPNINAGAIEAAVDVTEPMGNEVVLHLISGGQSFVARVDPRTRARVGHTVRVVADLDKLHFFDKSTERAIR